LYTKRNIVNEIKNITDINLKDLDVNLFGSPSLSKNDYLIDLFENYIDIFANKSSTNHIKLLSNYHIKERNFHYAFKEYSEAIKFLCECYQIKEKKGWEFLENKFYYDYDEETTWGLNLDDFETFEEVISLICKNANKILTNPRIKKQKYNALVYIHCSYYLRLVEADDNADIDYEDEESDYREVWSANCFYNYMNEFMYNFVSELTKDFSMKEIDEFLGFNFKELSDEKKEESGCQVRECIF